MGENIGFEKLIFANFCKLCEAISSRKYKKHKVKTLKEYTNSLRTQCPEASFHLLLRFLLPHMDRSRGSYGIKEHNLAKIYIRILDLPKEGKDATMLLNFRSPSTTAANDLTADFAEVAYWILKNRCGDSTNIEIGEVNNNLDKIAEEHAEHNPRVVDDILTQMLRKMSAIEQKWLMRLLLKRMCLGLGAKAIMETYHPDAMEVFDVSNSLLKVCTLLKNEHIRLHEIEISLYEPFRPMLSERCDISKIDFTGEHFIDEKLDGERFQVHFCDGKFKYFSRNGFDFTNNYGEDKESGYITSLITKQIKHGVESFIIDGEMMGWHSKRKCFLTKGSNIDVKSLRVGDIIQPCFCAFDVVYFNGNVLTNLALIKRLEILEKVFEPLEGVISQTPRFKVHTNEDILKALNSAIDNQLEGIIVKQVNSLYKANSRNSGWFKIKPEYSDGALIELDLLIIGGYYGEGKRKGNVNQFLLGLAEPHHKGGLQKFSSFCRVGSGYSMLELGELLNKLNPHWEKLRPGKIPSFLLLTKEKPDLWVEPSKSYVLQVKASEVIKSNLYHFGYTLRFPRVEKVRYDKSWNDCLTTLSFAEIVKTYTAKLTSGHLGKKRDARGLLVDQTALNQKLEIEKIGDIFVGKEFCVLTGDNNIPKAKMEKIIIEQSGTITNSAGVGTYCVIAGDENIRVRNIILSKKHIVATPKWVQTCIDAGKIVTFDADFVLSAPKRKEISMEKSKSDEAISLQSMINEISIPSEELISLADPEVLALDEEMFGSPSPYSIFRGVHVHFYKSSQDCNIPRTEELLFKFYSGIIDNIATERTNFIVYAIRSVDTSDVQFLHNNSSSKNCPVVDKQWIIDCCKQNKLIESANYIIRL